MIFCVHISAPHWLVKSLNLFIFKYFGNKLLKVLYKELNRHTLSTACLSIRHTSLKQARPLHTWLRVSLSDYEGSSRYKLDKERALSETSEDFRHTKLRALLSRTWK